LKFKGVAYIGANMSSGIQTSSILRERLFLCLSLPLVDQLDASMCTKLLCMDHDLLPSMCMGVGIREIFIPSISDAATATYSLCFLNKSYVWT
jgi:hypothetical protein